MPKNLPKSTYSLQDSPFFKLRSRKKLAALLRTSPATLKRLSHDTGLYVRKWKHKTDDIWLRTPPNTEQADLYRPIDIPDHVLKAAQSRIAQFLARITPPDFLFSPVKGRSYVDNAAYHRGSHAFWLLDVADYFPSCSDNNVARFFSKDLMCAPDVSAILVHLTTLNGSLPQGSPCSPILAYYSNRQTWLQIDQLVKAADCKFSLYADDITISGKIVRKALIWQIKKTLVANRLRLKSTKEVSLINGKADITGVIVKGDATFLPNRKMKLLAELRRVYASSKDGKARLKMKNQIVGRLAQRQQVERRTSA